MLSSLPIWRYIHRMLYPVNEHEQSASPRFSVWCSMLGEKCYGEYTNNGHGGEQWTMRGRIEVAWIMMMAGRGRQST